MSDDVCQVFCDKCCATWLLWFFLALNLDRWCLSLLILSSNQNILFTPGSTLLSAQCLNENDGHLCDTMKWIWLPLSGKPKPKISVCSLPHDINWAEPLSVFFAFAFYNCTKEINRFLFTIYMGFLFALTFCCFVFLWYDTADWMVNSNHIKYCLKN